MSVVTSAGMLPVKRIFTSLSGTKPNRRSTMRDGVIGRGGGLGRGDGFAFEIRHRLDRRIAVQVKDKSIDVGGDVDRVGAFEGEIDALVADHADLFAAGDDRLY